jgi:hypothetical protein
MNKIYKENKQIKEDKAIKNFKNGGIIENKININIKKDEILNLNEMYEIVKYDRYILYNIKKAKETIFFNKEIRGAKIQLLISAVKTTYNFILKKRVFKCDNIFYKNFNNLNRDEDINYDTDFLNVLTDVIGSDVLHFVIGYRILYVGKRNEEGEFINSITNFSNKKLKAFNPSNDRKFHDLTIESTHNNKICIYETFLIINNLLSLKYRRDNENNRKDMIERLKEEGEEIEKLVKEGDLIESLVLLNKKYNVDSYIFFYDDLNKNPIKIDNKGEIDYDYEIIENESDDDDEESEESEEEEEDNYFNKFKKNDEPKYEKFKNNELDTKRIYLYDEKKMHVAPSIYKNIVNRRDYLKDKIKSIEENRKTFKKEAEDNKQEIYKILDENKIKYNTDDYIDFQYIDGLELKSSIKKELKELLSEQINNYKSLGKETKQKIIAGTENTENNRVIKKAEKETYLLKPNNLKIKDDDDNEEDIETFMKNVIAYDIEIYRDENGKAIPYCLCIYGKLKGEDISKSFYGLNCINDFMEFLKLHIVLLNNNRSHKKEKVDYIKIYGYNSSKFDNIFIFKEFFKLDKNSKYIIAGSSIKYIEHNNLRFYDINLIYSGSLRSNCKKLGFIEEKGIFPYDFVNKDNINYIGEFPSITFFNKQDFFERDDDEGLINDDEETINKNYLKLKEETKIFDCKEYSIKYCLLDVKLTFQLVGEHVKNCIGIHKLNGIDKKFNVSSCKTGASLSLKYFNQVFQNDILEGSPREILEKEKVAYFGGRTELFKRKFKAETKDDNLYYFDINSSYPYSMTQNMPFKYIRTVKIKQTLKDVEDVVNYHLYGIKSYKYIGKDKENLINNLIERNDKGLNFSVASYNKNTFHWGKEIREAILNGFEVEIFEIIEYEGKPIFKDFAEFFYNERLKIKKINPSKALYFKLIMNSLYGKFGQRQFEKNEIAENDNDFWNIINNQFDFLKSIETIDENLSIITYEEKGDDIEYIGNLTRFSSYISAFSRSHLSEVMRDIGHKYIYYCDTDSLFTTKKPNKKYLDNNILGKWKEETETPIKEAVFIAPKMYFYECEDKTQEKKGKGIKAEELKKENYIDLNDGKIDNIKSSSLMFFRSLNEVIIKQQERTVKTIHNKRLWKDNNSIIFNNEEEYINNQN